MAHKSVTVWINAFFAGACVLIIAATLVANYGSLPATPAAPQSPPSQSAEIAYLAKSAQHDRIRELTALLTEWDAANNFTTDAAEIERALFTLSRIYKTTPDQSVLAATIALEYMHTHETPASFAEILPWCANVADFMHENNRPVDFQRVLAGITLAKTDPENPLFNPEYNPVLNTWENLLGPVGHVTNIQPPDFDPIVTGTPSSDIYHSPICPHLNNTPHSNRLTWYRSAAIADGRRACKTCRP